MDIEKIKFGFAGVALGAFALFGIGFGMFGWVLGGTAQERVEAAVIDRLTPICVAQFQRDPMKVQKLTALKQMTYTEHGKFVSSQGWATMPGEPNPDTAVAVKCGDRISG